MSRGGTCGTPATIHLAELLILSRPAQDQQVYEPQSHYAARLNPFGHKM